ncbi:MAG: signal recognition particle-docking protein FtsY, partial [Calditrichia bacterium]|nr:signal recognition particle-docking protein FtsY [Calditrichia bacterium]
MGIFDKFKKGLTKTRENVFGQITGLVKSSNKIDDETLEEIEELLIMGDVGMNTTMHIIENFKRRLIKEKNIAEGGFLEILKEEICEFIQNPDEIKIDKKPHVILVVGVNGTGKTTSIGKLAKQFKEAGHSVILGAADTFRAAAIDQLEIWAQRAGVDIIQSQPGSDPAAVAFDTVNAAVSRNKDVVIIDTAGRLHTKVNLMEELKKIKRVIGKKLEGAPHEVMLVLDATTGQNAISQAKLFDETVGVTGLVLTKLDGTA